VVSVSALISWIHAKLATKAGIAESGEAKEGANGRKTAEQAFQSDGAW
jgi:hypothetical protein